MPRETIVIALGGNSLLSSKKEFSIHQEIENIDESCRAIARIAKSGYRIVLTHGNGPQVGDILIQQELARDRVPKMPLDVCGAQTQGEIGYLIQRILRRHLPTRHIATVITQVVVDPGDKAFSKPTKFVGPFYKREPDPGRGKHYMRDSDRGYRRVVPSPEPLEIVEKREIKSLVERGFVVIACGGGGVPVIKKGRALEGVEGVIDKDLAAERLAHSVGAKSIMILTDVKGAAVHYGTRLEKFLGRIRIKEAEVYMMGGHFPPGSMGPKVEASIRFLRHGGRRAIITDREHAMKALQGSGGTVITR